MLPRFRYGAVDRPILARLAPALLAAAVTLLLGTVELRGVHAWRWFESPSLLPLIGVLFAGAAGLFACHLAQLSAAPRTPWPASVLPAALIVAALPGLQVLALLVPLAIGVRAALRLPGLRLAALIGLGGSVIAIAAAGLPGPALHLAGALAMLAAALLAIRNAARPAANDDVAAPFGTFWSLPGNAGCATQPPRTSSPVLGE